MNKKKGLGSKILIGVGLPLILVFVISIAVVVQGVNSSIGEIMDTEIVSQSQLAVKESAEFFDHYEQLTEQIADEEIYKAIIAQSSPNSLMNANALQPMAFDSLVNAYEKDKETIICIWVAGFATGEMISSDGWDPLRDDPGYVMPEREWYTAVMAAKDTIYTEPYVDATTGNVVTTIASPIFSGDVIRGVAAVDIVLTDLQETFANAKIGEKGYVSVFYPNGGVMYHPNEAYAEKNISDMDISQNVIEAMAAGTYNEKLEFDVDGKSMYGILSPLGNTGWTMLTCMPESEVKAATTATGVRMAIIFLVAAIILLFIIVKVSNSIVKPIRKLAVDAEKIAEGDVTVKIDIDPNGPIENEVQELQLAFYNVVENTKKQSEAARKIAQGDLSVEIVPRSDEDVLAHSMQQVIEILKELVEETDNMTKAVVEGDLDSRGNLEKFDGVYKQIVSGFNNTLEETAKPLKNLGTYLQKLSEGNPPPIDTDEEKGDFLTIQQSLNGCINAVNDLVHNSNILVDAAIAGEYSKRVDTGTLLGDYKLVIEGMNKLLSTVGDRATWYQSIIDAVPLPIHVMDNEMRWTLLNSACEKVLIDSGLVKNREEAYGMECCNAGATNCNTENCGIRQLCDNGISETYFDWGGKNNMQQTSYLKNAHGENIGFVEVVSDLTEIVAVNNYTKTEIERLQANLTKLAGGNFDFDMDIQAAGEHTEKVCEQFSSIANTLSVVKDAVGALVSDAGEMTAAAIRGDLRYRTDITKHGGEYADVMDGFNKTIDAIFNPLHEAMEVIGRMAEGDLHVMMEGQYEGAYENIKTAINTTSGNMLSYVGEISTVLAEIGGGNLDQKITGEYKGDFVEIKNSLNDILSSLNAVLTRINEAAEQVTGGAKQVSDGSQTLSQGSTQQASALQELTASVAEIASQTKQNATNAGKASQLAIEAKTSAVTGNQQMQSMLDSMEGINESSANISKIIKVIDDIAFQTNILALNAAVEAARAGEHGKGFAVVAEEVRTLAARSADAANETTELIEGSIRKVAEGTKIANDTAEALSQIVSEIEKTADLAKKIADASNEQASGIAQIDLGLEQVSVVVQSNSATSQESAAASEELYGQAEMLKRLVGTFRLTAETDEDPGMMAASLEGPAYTMEESLFKAEGTFEAGMARRIPTISLDKDDDSCDKY